LRGSDLAQIDINRARLDKRLPIENHIQVELLRETANESLQVSAITYYAHLGARWFYRSFLRARWAFIWFRSIRGGSRFFLYALEPQHALHLGDCQLVNRVPSISLTKGVIGAHEIILLRQRPALLHVRLRSIEARP